MIDEFTVEAVDIGPLKKLRIGHDKSGTAPGLPTLSFGVIWNLWSRLKEAQQAGSWTGWRSMLHRWDKNSASSVDAGWTKERMMEPSSGTFSQTPFRLSCTPHVSARPSTGRTAAVSTTGGVVLPYFAVVPYEIKVFTSDVFGAGTDADVFVVLYGRNAVCTQQKSLCVNKRERRMSFERGAEDMFIVEVQQHLQDGGFKTLKASPATSPLWCTAGRRGGRD